MGRRKTTDECIIDFKVVHGDKYDYSLIKYTNNKTKVPVVCNNHGIFYQRPDDHLNGHGCRKCADEENSKRLTYNTSIFIQKSNLKHDNFYDYSLVVYVHNKKKVKIMCPIHGIFNQAPCNHLNGQGCPDCDVSKKKDLGYFIKVFTIEEDPIEVDGNIKCKCSYCKEYFIPTRGQLGSRSESLRGDRPGESRLYCSDHCKNSCSVYNQRSYPKGFKVDRSREVQPELRQLVLERDNFQCQRCGSSKDLYCHHITGVEINPIESADMDNCITLCNDCHDLTHNQNGCHRSDMRRQPCITL